MADQKQITLYPGDATAKDIVLRELPVATVATTEIFLYPGDAVAKDVVLRSVPGAAADGSAASITGAGGIASLEAIGQPLVEAITGAADITNAGNIASLEAFGSAAVAAQVTASGITSDRQPGGLACCWSDTRADCWPGRLGRACFVHRRRSGIAGDSQARRLQQNLRAV